MICHNKLIESSQVKKYVPSLHKNVYIKNKVNRFSVPVEVLYFISQFIV